MIKIRNITYITGLILLAVLFFGPLSVKAEPSVAQEELYGDLAIVGEYYTSRDAYRDRDDDEVDFAVSLDAVSVVLDEDMARVTAADGEVYWTDVWNVYRREPLKYRMRISSSEAVVFSDLWYGEYLGLSFFGIEVTEVTRWTNLDDEDQVYYQGIVSQIFEDEDDIRPAQLRVSGFLRAEDVKKVSPRDAEEYHLLGRYWGYASYAHSGDTSKTYASMGLTVRLLMTCGSQALVLSERNTCMWVKRSDLSRNMLKKTAVSEDESYYIVTSDRAKIYTGTGMSRLLGYGYFGTRIRAEYLWVDENGQVYVSGTIRRVYDGESGELTEESVSGLIPMSDLQNYRHPGDNSYIYWIRGGYYVNEAAARWEDSEGYRDTDGKSAALIAMNSDLAVLYTQEDHTYLWVPKKYVYIRETRYTAQFINELRDKASPEEEHVVRTLGYMKKVEELVPLKGEKTYTAELDGKTVEYYYRLLRVGGQDYYQLRYTDTSAADAAYYTSVRKSIWNSESYGSINAVQKDILRLGFYLMSLEGEDGSGIRYGHGSTLTTLPSIAEPEVSGSSLENSEEAGELVSLAEMDLNSTGRVDQDGAYWFDCSGFVSFVERSVFRRALTPRSGVDSCSGPVTDFTFLGGYKAKPKKYVSYVLVNLFDRAKTTVDTGDNVLANLDQLEVGDLLFFYGAATTTVTQNGLYDHVGIYLGVNAASGVPEFLHCTSRKDADGNSIDGICVSPLTGTMAVNKGTRLADGTLSETGFVAAKRYLETEDLLE